MKLKKRKLKAKIDNMVRKELKLDFSEGTENVVRNLAYELSFNEDNFQIQNIPALYLYYQIQYLKNLFEYEKLALKLDKLTASIYEEAYEGGRRTKEATQKFIRNDPRWISLKAELLKQKMQTDCLEGIATAFLLKTEIGTLLGKLMYVKDGSIPVKEIMQSIVKRSKTFAKKTKGRIKSRNYDIE